MHRLKDHLATHFASIDNFAKIWRWCSVALLVTLGVLRPWQAAGQTTISVPDPNLQNAISWMLGKTNGLLTTADMLGLTNLTSWVAITNLSRLEYAV